MMVRIWGRWEFSINWLQWMIGFNVWEYGANVFFLCFRIGYHRDGYLGMGRPSNRKDSGNG